MSWNVWSKDPSRDVWIVVDTGSEAEAKAGAERRQQSARRVGFEARFVALPAGRTPHEEAVP